MSKTAPAPSVRPVPVCQRPAPRSPDPVCAEDHALQELCELQQHQFLLTCQIQDLERAGASDPLLPDLRTSLANVTAALQQRQPLEPSAGQGSRH